MASNDSGGEREIRPYRFEPEYDDDKAVNAFVRFEGEGGHGGGSLERPGSSSQPEAELEESRVGHCRWCQSDCCVPMTRVEESLCCVEDDAAAARKGPLQCVCMHDEFERVCLDKAVLDVALTGFFESRCDPDSRQNRYVVLPVWDDVPTRCS